jgi:hypothetical protein
MFATTSTPRSARPRAGAAPGAVEIDIDWGVVAEGAIPSRHFTGRRWVLQHRMGNGRVVDDVTVAISGWQWADGSIERKIVVQPRVGHWPLSVPQTRELARLLTAACDEIQRLESIDGIGRSE